MNKAQYKQLSHDIRSKNRRYAAYLREQTGKQYTTRGVLHNVLVWFDEPYSMGVVKGIDYAYKCIGDYENGLVWGKTI